ncbi:MAG TPA: protease modulator HflC [Candidatus Tectomicrobia bacterium]|nr:protease modulator HflC [Candidatus Tectomicrobia bacterium]
MPRASVFWWIVGVCILLVVVSRTFYAVSETEQVVITQLGRPVRLVKAPGLYLKVPFLQQLTFFENRLLDYDAAAAPVITRDKKNLVVDNYAKWQISDPLKFLQTVQNEAGAQARLDDIIYSKVREQLGLHDLVEVIATKRNAIMQAVTASSHEASSAYGIAVVDVRIKRADLPAENAQAVYGRMRTEREREAKRYRSEGQEEGVKIRAETDKQKTIMLADAYAQEQKIRGEGDAVAIRVYGEAFRQDPDFFAFVRTLEAYRKSLTGKTTLLLPPQMEFLKYLRE